MINELYQLSEAMDRAGVQTQRWHSKYKLIPNIRPNAPCVRISIFEGLVVELSSVPEDLGKGLRKFGDNQGSYPCMNLMPLYRITDESIKKSLKALKPEHIDPAKIEEIESWCQDNRNNWGKKFQNKYKICMDRSTELCKLIPKFAPIQILTEESKYFCDPIKLHREMKATAFEMLRNQENVLLALRILFYQGDPTKKPEDDCGSLSIALETPKLIDNFGFPAISAKFVLELNNALMQVEKKGATSEFDAFGVPFAPVGKSTPMPTAKLAGGFDATLRTMFGGQPCQMRYGRIEDASYPISPEMRGKLHASLDWLGGSKEHENITWMSIDKGEVLFAYPSRIHEQAISYTRMFGRPQKSNVIFEEQTKQFITELRQGREVGADAKADRIQLFILKKLDKARVKVVYTRQTDAHELEECSEAWTLGCSNLPVFHFGKLKAPFPLEAAAAFNMFWKQNGEQATDQCRPVSQYHGLELLMTPELSVTADLHMLSEKAMTVGAFLGSLLAKKNFHHSIWEQITKMLALMGLMLYRKGIGKENYMEDFPYQYGQLLKVSDELHAMYCRVVRNGDLPSQLAGSGLYQAAAEAPLRTMSLLAQRMNPYIAWAKTYHTVTDSQKETGAGLAKWFLRIYEEIAGKLYEVWTPNMRFNDEERAQLFIGYLAALPKREESKDKDAEVRNQIEEV